MSFLSMLLHEQNTHTGIVLHLTGSFMQPQSVHLIMCDMIWVAYVGMTVQKGWWIV